MNYHHSNRKKYQNKYFSRNALWIMFAPKKLLQQCNIIIKAINNHNNNNDNSNYELMIRIVITVVIWTCWLLSYKVIRTLRSTPPHLKGSSGSTPSLATGLRDDNSAQWLEKTFIKTSDCPIKSLITEILLPFIKKYTILSLIVKYRPMKLITSLLS